MHRRDFECRAVHGTAPATGTGMTRLTFDDVRRSLPHLDELRPVLDHLLTRSAPDADRKWSGSGELGTAGTRLVDARGAAETSASLAEREHQHLASVYRAVTESVQHLDRGDHTAAALALLRVASIEEQRDRPGRAEAYAEAAHRAARSGPDQSTTGLALRRWGRAARAQGKLAEAEEHYASGYEIARAVGDLRGGAEAAIGAGNVLQEQGRWVESEAWYRRALSTLDELAEPAEQRWHALLNLHVVLRSRGETEASISSLEEAERVAQALGDESATQFIENARGQLHMARDAFDLGERNFRAALESSTGAQASVTIRLNLAECLLALDRSLDAAEEAREAEREALVAGLVTKLPEVYRLLGRIASAQANPDAFVLFERALEIVESRGLPKLEKALTLQAYATAEARSGDPEAANQLLELAADLYREVGIENPRHEWADRYAPPHGNHTGGEAGSDTGGNSTEAMETDDE